MTALQRQIDRLITHRASEWHQILEHASEAQRAEFVRWLKTSPLHVEEYLATVYTDRILDQVDFDREEDVDRMIAALIAEAPHHVAALTENRSQERRPTRRGWYLAGSASAALALIALGFFLMPSSGGAVYTTALGEQRSVQLSDKSLVTLNVDSQIEVRMSGRARLIRLIRGEALFNAAPDAKRPFIVETSGATVRALGTQFNIHNVGTGARVTVLDGRVKLESGVDPAGKPSAILAAGDEADILAGGTISKASQPDIARSVAWRDRQLIFDNTPLEEIISEFNRYNVAVKLVVEDVPPRTYHYSGIFDATDPESLVALLSAEKDFQIERRPQSVVIRMAPGNAP